MGQHKRSKSETEQKAWKNKKLRDRETKQRSGRAPRGERGAVAVGNQSYFWLSKSPRAHRGHGSTYNKADEAAKAEAVLKLKTKVEKEGKVL